MVELDFLVSGRKAWLLPVETAPGKYVVADSTSFWKASWLRDDGRWYPFAYLRTSLEDAMQLAKRFATSPAKTYEELCAVKSEEW